MYYTIDLPASGACPEVGHERFDAYLWLPVRTLYYTITINVKWPAKSLRKRLRLGSEQAEPHSQLLRFVYDPRTNVSKTTPLKPGLIRFSVFSSSRPFERPIESPKPSRNFNVPSCAPIRPTAIRSNLRLPSCQIILFGLQA